MTGLSGRTWLRPEDALTSHPLLTRKQRPRGVPERRAGGVAEIKHMPAGIHGKPNPFRRPGVRQRIQQAHRGEIRRTQIEQPMRDQHAQPRIERQRRLQRA